MKHEGGCVRHAEYVTWKSGSQNTGEDKGRKGQRNTHQNRNERGSRKQRGEEGKEDREKQKSESLRAREAKKDPDPDRWGAGRERTAPGS